MNERFRRVGRGVALATGIGTVAVFGAVAIQQEIEYFNTDTQISQARQEGDSALVERLEAKRDRHLEGTLVFLTETMLLGMAVGAAGMAAGGIVDSKRSPQSR